MGAGCVKPEQDGPPTGPGSDAPTLPARIGLLGLARSPDWHQYLAIGLAQLGYRENIDYFIEYRFGAGDRELLDEYARELIALPVDLVVTIDTPAAQAVAHESGAIPIVMAVSGDPVAVGLAESRARPGKNATGHMTASVELSRKRVQLAKDLFPSLGVIGFVSDPSNPVRKLEWDETQAAAIELGMTALEFHISSGDDVPHVFEAASVAGTGAIIVAGEAFLGTHRQLIMDSATKHSLPVVFEVESMVRAGGLASVGVSFPVMLERSAVTVDKILRGTPPGVIPIQRAIDLEGGIVVTVNRVAAESWGLLPLRPRVGAQITHWVE
jgi:putative ABC transport system substrate-binding protein